MTNDDLELERLLRAALRRTGEPAPFAVDVAERVMSRVAELGAPAHSGLGVRQLVRWTVAASLLGASLLAIAAWYGPSAHELALIAGRAIAATTGAAIKLAAPVGALAESVVRVGSALLESARTVVQPLAPFQPLARVLLAAITMAMLAITTHVVVRDLRAGGAHKEHP